jgi:Na+-translocating ferredoxin:NAD+ oxidoreductase RnfD subunit
MFRMRQLKLLYALAGLLWVGYCCVELFKPHIANHIPISSGTLLCLLLFVSVPALGYVLLFKLFPVAGRRLRR